MRLTPIEAGLCGLPVVYTDYGGVVDFMEDGFFPVSYSMTRVGVSGHETGPYGRDALWAEADLDDAERQLRRALALAQSGESAISLASEHKKLVENLVAAQADVVATAVRLVRLAEDESEQDNSELLFKL